jgi:DNA-binding NarL/FixJ family response regulator
VWAEALVLVAARALAPDHTLTSRAWGLAGHVAHLTDRYALGIERHAKAETFATTARDRHDAIWGQFSGAAQLEKDICIAAIERLGELEDPTPEGTLRFAVAQYGAFARGGSLVAAEAAMEEAAQLIGYVRNPWHLSNFMNAYGRLLSLRGSYDAALEQHDRQMAVVEGNGLTFAMASTLANRAQACLGRRDFAGAARALGAAQRWGEALSDHHNLLDARAIELRFLLARRSFGAASQLLLTRPAARVGLAMEADYEATRALVLASAGAPREGIAAAEAVPSETTEATTLAAAAAAVALLRLESTQADDAIEALLETVALGGSADSLVAAYRAHPALLKRIVELGLVVDDLRHLLRAAHDHGLAARVGVYLPPDPKGPHSLSKREVQVLDLVAQGLTNKEIARLLVVQEVTVKVHVRHIFEKLGVRNRVEAVSRYR